MPDSCRFRVSCSWSRSGAFAEILLATAASAQQVVPGLLGLIDDPHRDAKQRQPEGEYEASRLGASDQDQGISHR